MAKIKGAIVVDTERCKGCNLCVVACPLDVIALIYLDHYYKSCYLCSPIRRARAFGCLFFPFRTERLGNKRRALKKTSQNIWQFKINPLPLHPLLKRSRI